MNVLKSRYPELDTLIRLYPNPDERQRHLFRGVYLTQKLSPIQLRHWKELTARKSTVVPTDPSTFLFDLLSQCYAKNRSNILLMNINLKTVKLSRQTFVYEDYLHRNIFVAHLCLSSLWRERRQIIPDDALIYLVSELTLVECLSRKRKLFMQLSGTHETFYSLPYYQTRTVDEKKRADARLDRFNRRKRTIHFHLHATQQGQQAHLTDLYETCLARHLMHYHVSRYERFDVHHAVEKSSSGDVLLEAMIDSTLSKTFFQHRPKAEVDEIRQHLLPIFERFHLHHHRFYLRRRSRMPLSYTRHLVPEPTATLDQLICLTTPVSIVQHFVRVWLRRVLPLDFFGSKFNQKLFIQRMCFLIQLPRRQQYSLGDVVRHMKLSRLPWSQLRCDRSSLLRQLYSCHVIYFLIEYVLVLIRSYFYVTEASSPSHPMVLVFYRHKVW